MEILKEKTVMQEVENIVYKLAEAHHVDPKVAMRY
jgi:hypothetical protein